MDIAILGAGLTGLTLASKLAAKGSIVTLFDRNSKIGGLCKTDMVDGFVYDLHGGHVFNSKHADVVSWVFQHLPVEKWHFSRRDARIRYHNITMSYPFELALSELPAEETIDCLLGFFEEKGDKPENFHDWLIWMFGPAIAEKYMLPYNRKIWNYDLRHMAIDWVDGKMPLPTKREILEATLTKESHESRMPHSSYYYPKENGIGSVIQLLAPMCETFLGFEVEQIHKRGKKWFINEMGPFDHIFWTIPLPFVAKYLVAPEVVTQAAHSLRWNSITTFLYASDDPTPESWTYYPSKDTPYHRIVNQGALSPQACPQGKGSFTVEMIGRHDPKELKGCFPACNFLAHSYTEFAYVLFDANHAKNSRTVKEYLEGEGITPLGRFGEWQYYNMDICIKRAFDCAEEFRVE